jgi:hypothetical protein
MKQRLVVAVSAAVLAVAGVSAAAFAGEVKGPPGSPTDTNTWTPGGNTNTTAAPDHANSNCAYSGLNDFDSTDPVGQLASQVQTAADAWKFYGLEHGYPGKDGACRGGTNEERTK